MGRRGFRADDAGPDAYIPESSDLVDSVLALLEEAGVPTEINDRIVKLIKEWEWSQQPPEPDYPEPPEGSTP